MNKVLVKSKNKFRYGYDYKKLLFLKINCGVIYIYINCDFYHIW